MMFVRVAAGAFGGEAQKGAGEILVRHHRSGLRRDARFLVAIAAVESRVPAFQRVSGLAVVKGRKRGFPANQRVVSAIVLGVAGDAAVS